MSNQKSESGFGIVLSATPANIGAARRYLRRQISCDKTDFEDPFYIAEVMSELEAFIETHFTTEPPHTQSVELNVTLDPEYISVNMICMGSKNSPSNSQFIRIPRHSRSKNLLRRTPKAS